MDDYQARQIFCEVKMLASVMEVLSALGLLTAIQFAAVAVIAIFVFRYFTDRS